MDGQSQSFLVLQAENCTVEVGTKALVKQDELNDAQD